MIDSCGRCHTLYETTTEDAYDPRPEMHRCRECWRIEHPAESFPAALGVPAPGERKA